MPGTSSSFMPRIRLDCGSCLGRHQRLGDVELGGDTGDRGEASGGEAAHEIEGEALQGQFVEAACEDTRVDVADHDDRAPDDHLVDDHVAGLTGVPGNGVVHVEQRCGQAEAGEVLQREAVVGDAAADVQAGEGEAVGVDVLDVGVYVLGREQ